jgi:hypothetical protein
VPLTQTGSPEAVEFKRNRVPIERRQSAVTIPMCPSMLRADSSSSQSDQETLAKKTGVLPDSSTPVSCRQITT